ncbi:DUF6491 family protein [Phenylobacterium sp.]|uniref:DUF6491 family protein n=1 Tax=Phenylobacterium sp. TaxID=1871053 RepID=UPI002E311443|nr:DUF6491 family protein [Phenylobacterium sp.]HEX2560932.1 DUF6491 family protein [Phenylobacterium sp.]
MPRLLLTLALSGGLAACAGSPGAGPAGPAGAESPRQCFWARSVNSFSAVDDDTVNLRVGVKDYYQLELIGPCPDIDWAQQIAIQSRGGSSVCVGSDAVLIAPSHIGPQRCHVRTVRRLTPQEVEAMDPKARP